MIFDELQNKLEVYIPKRIKLIPLLKYFSTHTEHQRFMHMFFNLQIIFSISIIDATIRNARSLFLSIVTSKSQLTSS